MISRLKGIIVDRSLSEVTIDVQGVGYSVTCSAACLENLILGEEAEIVIHTDVREDNITLYGFNNKLERQTFMLLKTVKGVGSRSASEIISQVNTLDLLRIIGSGDSARLQAVRGIGKKTAERIIVELKEKVGDYATERSGRLNLEITRSQPIDDAIEALKSLGFSQSQAEQAIRRLESSGISGKENPGELVRQALQFV